MGIKAYLIIASYVFAILLGWQSHTYYDGYLKTKEEKSIIDDRIREEAKSNALASIAATDASKEREKERKSDAILEKHIEEKRSDFRCAVPAIGVRDLQQAVTGHGRSR